MATGMNADALLHLCDQLGVSVLKFSSERSGLFAPQTTALAMFKQQVDNALEM